MYPCYVSENRDINEPDLFEGDMRLTPEQRGRVMMGMDFHKSDRQGAAIRQGLWPGGVIVYDIKPTLGKLLILFCITAEEL